MNWRNVPLGSVFQELANSSALTPATAAQPSRASPPPATACSIMLMVLDMAVPAASQFWPVEAMAVAQASVCAVENPYIEAAAPMRLVMLTMEDSCVGMLLPRRTSASPKRFTSPSPQCMTFDSWPMAVAMDSASMSVAMSRLETTSPKFSNSPTAMPSWPPRASISRMVSAETGWVDANSRALSLSLAKSASVPSTVFFMSRNAPSMVSAESTALYATTPMPALTVALMEVTKLLRLPVLEMDPMSRICPLSPATLASAASACTESSLSSRLALAVSRALPASRSSRDSDETLASVASSCERSLLRSSAWPS